MHAQTTHIFLKNKAYHNRKLTYSALPNQEVFSEMEEKYGEVEEMNICDNLGDHLVGNVYVKVSVALYPTQLWFNRFIHLDASQVRFFFFLVLE